MILTTKSKIVLATLALGLWISAPVVADKTADKAAAAPAETKTDDAVTTAITEAKAAKKKAASVGGEWRDVGKFIKKAEEAAKSGDTKKALKLANKAKFQSEMGYEQAMSEEKLTKEFPAYLK